MKTILLLITLLLSSNLLAQDIKLPEPKKSGGMPLMETLNKRHSNRKFANKELSNQQLSNLLWAAFGFNRAEKRTAPSSLNHQEIQIYVTLKSGFYLYDAKNNKLIQKGKNDIRKNTGEQDYVATAPLNLVYVANFADNPKINKEDNLNTSYVNTGFISQNVYLYCTSEGLTTVARGYVNRDALKKTLKLHKENVVIISQSVGFAK